MIILGLTHPISWNNAACVLVDGELIAMAEEERFHRIKHAPRMPASRAMEYCLQQAGISLEQVDFVAIGYDSAHKLSLGEAPNDRDPLPQWIRDVSYHEQRLPLEELDVERVVFVNHHMAHAASAFFASDFPEANILSLDGSGGRESGVLAVGQGKNIEILRTLPDAQSWGNVYELVTEALGFRPHSGEGKTMGLAAYADPDPKGLPFVDWGGDFPTVQPLQLSEFVKGLVPRRRHEPLTSDHEQLAATLQDTLERAARQMVQWLFRTTGKKQLCLAGGVALNCSMNGKLAQLPWVHDLFVQPAAHDAGTALGAALAVYTAETGCRPNWHMQHAYWGPAYDDESILTALRSFVGIRFHRSRNVCIEAAQYLADGLIIGWFQGRLEIGPRALGNRSILADPSNPAMKDIINAHVKNREPWRPFAPSILEEAVDRYLEKPMVSPYMILAFDTTHLAQSELVSAIHVDGTCRPQTVNQETNPRFWELIKHFRELTGVPALLNTSFNVGLQPIVNTPYEALDTFIGCGIDVLVIGDYMVRKEKLGLLL